MDARDRRAREIQADIAAILLHDWDPIGVADEPAAQDEYDAHVGGVYRLIASGASVDRIARHLRRIEEEMGLPGATDVTVVAEKLAALDVRLETD